MRFGLTATVFCVIDEVMRARGQVVPVCESSTFAGVSFSSDGMALSMCANPPKSWTLHPQGIVCPSCSDELVFGDGTRVA